MKIGGRDYSEIHVMDENGQLIASITDQDIIEAQCCKVVCISGEKEQEKRRLEEKYTAKPEQFICNEAFNIFCDATDPNTKLEALKILAAQRY